MIRKLVVPVELGQGAEVRVLLWHKRERDPIAAGQALVELETDKAIVLVIAGQAGFLRQACAVEGGWLKVGDVAALVADALDEPLPESLAAVEGMLAQFEAT